MLSNVLALIEAAGEQIEEVAGMYQASLQAQAPSGRLQVAIKNVLENQRSALDHTAHAITGRWGLKGRKTYFPSAEVEARFPSELERHMPGVAAGNAEVAAAIERHQPYQPGHSWMQDLYSLTNENKHSELTPQIRAETRMRQAGPVTWDPGAVTFGSGVSIGGEQIDVRTQRTAGTVELLYIDWLFRDPPKSALAVLRTIQSGLVAALDDIYAVTGL